MENMIKDINIFSAKSKLSRSIADSTHDIPEIKFYILEVITQKGINGQGYLLAFSLFTWCN